MKDTTERKEFKRMVEGLSDVGLIKLLQQVKEANRKAVENGERWAQGNNDLGTAGHKLWQAAIQEADNRRFPTLW